MVDTVPNEAPRLPHLFIAGFTKCATGSLHRWLTHHPMIFGGVRKELAYLYDQSSYFYRPECNWNVSGPEGYDALFRPARELPAKAILLDSTPAYAYHDTARREIGSMSHEPLCVFVRRDPVDQISSTYYYFSNNNPYIDKNISIENFYRMLLSGENKTRFAHDHLKNALEYARFDHWLRLWRRDLGNDRVMVFDMKAMLRDPTSAIFPILAHFGLDRSPFEDYAFPGANETYYVKRRWLQQINVIVRGSLPHDSAIYQTMRRLYRRINSTSVKPVSTACEQHLRSRIAARLAENKLPR